MNRHRLILGGLVVLGASLLAGTWWLFPALARTPTQATTAQPTVPPQPGTAPAQNPAAPNTLDAGVRLATAEYVKAFNSKNAQAAAAMWTADGEYIGPDGVAYQGRAAIQKSLADDFQMNPKATIEIRLLSIRPIGRQAALAEGLVTVKTPGEVQPSETRYSALQVFEDGMWKAATVHEWVPDPEAAAATKLLDWLVGDWTAKGRGGSIHISYAWNEGKTFLTGKYTIAREGKPITSGTEILGRDPNGGLRSWTFDNGGTFSNGLWHIDGSRWVDEAIGTLTDGTIINSTNLLVPLGPDSYTWQTIDRTADNAALPSLPPVKVTRVQAEKK